MAAIYEFPIKISCNHAISWSPDHRIALCTDTAVKVLTLSCGVDNTECTVKCEQTSFPVNPDIWDIPQFTVNGHKYLINNLSREELKTLSVDRVLNPMKYQIETVARTGYAAVEWSPTGADLVGRSILATLSHDYRLCLYTQGSSQHNWSQICDLTVLRQCATKPACELTSVDDYYRIKDWCFSQAVTVLKWCPNVFSAPEKGRKFILLAAGTKTGHILFWKVNIPCQNKDDCSILNTVQPHKCQTSGLEWSQQADLLTVGYVDGQIHVINIDLQDPALEPTDMCVHAESDLMKVTSMCVLDRVKIGRTIVLVNKEHCVMAFQLDSVNHTVISWTHLFLQSHLPATGMSAVTNNSVLMMSQDAVLQKITVRVEENGIKLLSNIVHLDLPADTSWISAGCCLSPNIIFIAFIIRPKPGYDHLAIEWRKASTKVHIRCLDDLDVGTSCQETCVAELNSITGPLGTYLDILEIYRQGAQSKQSVIPDNLSPSASEKQILRNLQLRRYGTMALFRRLKHKEEEENVVEKLEKEAFQSSCQILAMFVKTCVAKVDRVKIMSESRKDINFVILHAMKSWLEACSDHFGDMKGIPETRQRLEEIVGVNGESKGLNCGICSSKMQGKQLTWQCTNGHCFAVCCKTLLPVEGVDYITCMVCNSHARPPESLKEMEWLDGDCNRCTFCEGLMM